RVSARLGPWPESPARLVALGVESDRLVEIVHFERDAPEQVRQSRQVQLVARGLGVVDQSAILRERPLVVAAGQVGVAEVIERQADEIPRMLAARKVEPLAEMRDRALVFAVPLEMPAGEREALRQQTDIAGLASKPHGF